MSTSVRSLTVYALLSSAPLLALAQTAAAPAVAEAQCTGRATLSAFEQRVIARAQEGPSALRNYLYITRGIYNMSYEDAVKLVDRQRTRERSCDLVAESTPTR